MKLTTREITLGWCTMVVLLLGGTYLMGQSRVKEWKDGARARQLLEVRKKAAERLLKQGDSITERTEAIRQRLPQYDVGKDVTTEFLRSLERTAKDNKVVLLRREPDRERSVGEIYEVAINCSWEGELDGLTRFLYALQTQGAMLDIRQLLISPVPGAPGRLKGTFTVEYAYTRAEAPLTN